MKKLFVVLAALFLLAVMACSGGGGGSSSGGESVKGEQSITLTSSKGMFPIYKPENKFAGGSISVPVNTVNSSITLEIGDIETSEQQRLILRNQLSIKPYDQVFNERISIRLPYDEKDLVDAGIVSKRSLFVEYYDSSKSKWLSVPIKTNNTHENYLVFNTNSAGIYRIHGANSYYFSPDSTDLNTKPEHDQIWYKDGCSGTGAITYYARLQDNQYNEMTYLKPWHPTCTNDEPPYVEISNDKIISAGEKEVYLHFKPQESGDLGWGKGINKDNASEWTFQFYLNVDEKGLKNPLIYIVPYGTQDGTQEEKFLYDVNDEEYRLAPKLWDGGWDNEDVKLYILPVSVKWTADGKPYLGNNEKRFLIDKQGHLKIKIIPNGTIVKFYWAAVHIDKFDPVPPTIPLTISMFKVKKEQENVRYRIDFKLTGGNAGAKYAVDLQYGKDGNYKSFKGMTDIAADQDKYAYFYVSENIHNEVGTYFFKIVVKDASGIGIEKIDNTGYLIDTRTSTNSSPPTIRILSPARDVTYYRYPSSSSDIVISGYVTDDKELAGEITLKNNTTGKSFTNQDKTGSTSSRNFQFTVDLNKGKNAIVITASDNSGNKSQYNITVELVDIDSVGPEIQFSEKGQTVETTSMPVFVLAKIYAEENSTIADVYAIDSNGTKLNPYEVSILPKFTGAGIYNQGDQKWKTFSPPQIQAKFRFSKFKNGINTFQIYAIDSQGDKSSDYVWIKYNGNKAPQVSSVNSSNPSPQAGQDFVISLTFSDPDGDNVSVTLDRIIGNDLWETKNSYVDGNTYYITFRAGNPGDYTMVFNLFDGELTTSYAYDFKVYPPPNGKPTASIIYPSEGDSFNTAAAINFNGEGTDSDGSIAAYEWDFGDGTEKSSQKETSHSYTSAGMYTVTLTVTDNLGATSSTSKHIVVISVPIEPQKFTIMGQVTSGGVGLANVTVTVTGDGGSSVLTNENGIYSFYNAKNGNYTISASRTGYAISPSSIPVTVNNDHVTGKDFTATGNNTTPIDYNISGQVTLNGSGLADVTVTLTGASPVSTKTDSSGHYSFSGAAKGNYTLTASKTGYSISPSSIPVTVNNANVTDKIFTATTNTTPIDYNISGKVSGDVQAGVTITLIGNGSRSTITNATGNFIFSGAANGSYILTASLAGYSISPSSIPVTVINADVTGKIFTATANGGGGSIIGYWEIYHKTDGTDGDDIGPDYMQIYSNTEGTWLCGTSYGNDIIPVTVSLDGNNITIMWYEGITDYIYCSGTVNGSSMSGTWSGSIDGSPYGTWRADKVTSTSCP